MYREKYNYSLYVINSVLFNKISYLPEDTKLIYDNTNKTEDMTLPEGSSRTLAEGSSGTLPEGSSGTLPPEGTSLTLYREVINSIISINNKYSEPYDITTFYNIHGLDGFNIFNYSRCFNILKKEDLDNDLWFDLYTVLKPMNRFAFLEYIMS